MIDFLQTIKRELLVVFVGAMPLFELRGAIPLGVSLGLSPLHSTILSIIGNMLPVPFLLKLLNPIMNYFEKIPFFSKIVKWVKKRTLNKSDKIKKYSIIGLFILVAIPLPSTGAWTGCVAATLFRIGFNKAITSIYLGIITAGIIVFTLTYNVVSFF